MPAKDNADNATGFWGRATIRFRVGPLRKPTGRAAWPRCAECGKLAHPDRILERNGLRTCLDCAEQPDPNGSMAAD